MTGALALSAAALVSTRQQYDHLFDIYVPIGLGVFALVVVLTAFALLRYRRRPPEKAARWHEHHPLEGTYAIVLVAIVAFLLWETFTSEHKVDVAANQERGGVTIDVIASRWEWTFYYPAYHIRIRSGVTGDNAFVVPTNEPIHFWLSSVDVIHSFWIPALRYKHDNFPGATMEATLTFTQSGRFPGQCAEFCGLDHSEMVFDARAVSRARFAAWAASGGKAGV
jgi:cytochrome c oxidase subunit 2